MSTYEDDVFAALTTPAGEGTSEVVMAAVADVMLKVGTRIHPTLAPTNQTKPYIIYEEISTEGQTALDGPSGVEFPLVQFTVWDGKRNTARDIRKSLRTILEGNLLPGPHEVVATFSNQYLFYDKETKSFGALVEFRLNLKP